MKIIFYLLFAVSFFLSHTVVSQVKTARNDDDKLYPSAQIVTRYHNSWTQTNYRKRIENFRNDPLKFGEIVFIGNSITQQGGDWTQYFETSGIRNRGIAGDVTDGVLKRLDEVVYFKPKAVFLLIGINDLFNLHHDLEKRTSLKYDKIISSPKYVAKNVLKIARKIHHKSPDTKIFVRTVLPTRRDFLIEDIETVNRILKERQGAKHFEIIDFYAEFVDENGFLKKELTKDGVHLNEAGYQKWVEIEKPIIENIIN